MENSATVEEDKEEEGIVYYALNNYGVGIFLIVANIVLVTLAVWIVILNFLVLDTLVRIKAQSGTREPADWLVSSLSLADLVAGVFLIYNTTYNLANYQIRIECLLRLSLVHVSLFSSVLHLGLLTADRYIKIVFPYRYGKTCNTRSVTFFIIITWIVSILLALMPSLGWSLDVSDVPDPENKIPVCSYFGLFHPDYLRLIVCTFFVPFVVMVLLYAHIFKVASRHAREIAAQEGGKGRERHSWKYTKTVMIVMGLYFLCWLPIGVVIILHVTNHLAGYTVVDKGNMLIYAGVLAWTNSIINPIIYAVKISAVRARFRAFFCRGRNSRVMPEISVTQTSYRVRRSSAWTKTYHVNRRNTNVAEVH